MKPYKTARGLEAKSEVPRKRRVRNIVTKVEVLDNHKKGMKTMEISRVMGIPESTVRLIIKNETKIRQSVRHASVIAAQTMKRSMHEMMSLIESMLFQWICDRRTHSLPANENLIQKKALSLYKNLKSNHNYKFESIPSFKASRGWLAGFKRRFKLKSDLSHREAASSDFNSVPSFVVKFKEIISQCGYSPHQVFNVEETGLYWKKLPSKTLIPEAEKSDSGFKPSQDQVTLLLGGNASGSVKLIPLILYKSENPGALQNIDNGTLPVIWKRNPKAWVTRNEFIQWFRDYFVPFVEKFNQHENLENKALLLLSNVQGHPLEELNDMFPHIKVIFLPRNAAPLIQPMDQGVIRTFKAYYLRGSLKRLVDEIDKTEGGIKYYWRHFGIKEGLKIIKDGWKSVSSSTMNFAWKNLWPECVKNMSEDSNDSDPISDIKALAKEAGFSELTSDDIDEILRSHGQEHSSEELAAINEDDNERNITEMLAKILPNEVIEASVRKKDLAEFLELAEKLKNKASSVEADERKLRSFHQTIDALMSCYKGDTKAEEPLEVSCSRDALPENMLEYIAVDEKPIFCQKFELPEDDKVFGEVGCENNFNENALPDYSLLGSGSTDPTFPNIDVKKEVPDCDMEMATEEEPGDWTP